MKPRIPMAAKVTAKTACPTLAMRIGTSIGPMACPLSDQGRPPLVSTSAIRRGIILPMRPVRLEASSMGRSRVLIDHLSDLQILGSRQRLRVCATHAGLTPLLVVQAGPGLPLLNEVPQLQRTLRLETHFTVYYWEQRGC